jgi:hypothetical protein
MKIHVQILSAEMIAVIILNAVMPQKTKKIVLTASAQIPLAVTAAALADNIVQIAIAQTLQ